MTRFLIFDLVAPLAAFGSIAVGEHRSSQDRPAKSAVLGLVAGALGIERSNDDAHAALARDLYYAVRIEGFTGTGRHTSRRLMTDYHTAQSPPRSRKVTFATRRDEVADKQSLSTILSSREYRTDCSFTVALWPRTPAPRFSPEDLAQALRRPVFVPYLGRKSCPLMLPMLPTVLEAPTARDAFARRDADAVGADRYAFRRSHGLTATSVSLACDADAATGTDGGPEDGGRRERKRDHVLNRRRWQFTMRDEIVAPWTEGAA